jgi:isopentenyldiphosphate isomerase
MGDKFENDKEMFPLVDEKGNIIGAASRAECHDGSKKLHPVVHLHIFNSKGELLLQKRPTWKKIQPNKWDTAVGGHVDLGENISQALKRETLEEEGIYDYIPEFITSYIFESKVERELVFVYKTIYDGEIHPSKDELATARFWNENEIKDNVGKNVFTPNFEQELNRIKLFE